MLSADCTGNVSGFTRYVLVYVLIVPVVLLVVRRQTAGNRYQGGSEESEVDSLWARHPPTVYCMILAASILRMMNDPIVRLLVPGGCVPSKAQFHNVGQPVLVRGT